MGASRSELECHLIEAWASFKDGEIEDCAAALSDAENEASQAIADGFDYEPVDEPVDEPHTIVERILAWRIWHPKLWRMPWSKAAQANKVCESKTKGKKYNMKKLIAIIIVSAVGGAAGNHLSDFGTGPVSLDRGEFAAILECGSCEAIRLNDVAICTECGATDATDKIAAPLTHRTMGLFPSDDGWQFKDGSTSFHSEGEYVVPKLVVKSPTK